MPDPKPRKHKAKKGAVSQSSLREDRTRASSIPSTLPHMASRSFHGYGGPRVGGTKAPAKKLIAATPSHLKAAKRMHSGYKPTASRQALKSYKRAK